MRPPSPRSRSVRSTRWPRRFPTRSNRPASWSSVCNLPYSPNEFKDPERQDHRLRRRSDECGRRDPGSDGRLPGGRLRQDHSVDPGRHLRRRHVLVHRQQGTRADRRLRRPTSRRAPCGRSRRARRSTRTTPAARRSPCRPRPPRRPTSCPPRARRAPTPASPRSTSSSSTARTPRPTRVVLGQADAMSADSPVTAYADQAEQRQARAGGRDLRLRAVRVARREGLAAGAGRCRRRCST